jgi:hypothetical protein
MFPAAASAPSPPSLDREARLQQLLDRLRAAAEPALRQMADALLDLPEDRLLGQVETTLRDLGLQAANAAHQAALDGAKKKATGGAASPARTAAATPSSSTTSPRPS